MAHYDSCYEADREEDFRRRNSEATTQLKKLADELTLDQKEFLVKVGKNVEDYMIFFRILDASKYRF